MAIISPQRNAILSFENIPEAPPLLPGQKVVGSDGQALYPAGISQGSNSRPPNVLVLIEGGPSFSDEEIGDCDYAVLLRNATPEELETSKEVGSTALETVELVSLRPSDVTPAELVAAPTGQAATYSRIC